MCLFAPNASTAPHATSRPAGLEVMVDWHDGTDRTDHLQTGIGSGRPWCTR